MKPKDLKPPFIWGKQFTTIQDKIFYTFEPYGHEPKFSFPGWNHPHVFNSDKPIKIEYCSGNGDWIAYQALQDPYTNWVSVEKLFDRVRKIWSKTKNNNLENLFCVCGEALYTTKQHFPSNSVSEIYINFPDPWPKKKHAKYRLIQTPFIDEMHRILKDKGTITLVTDDEDYSIQMIDEFCQHLGFISCYPEPYFLTHREDYGTSYFYALWREKGKCIRFHLFQKVS